MSSSNNNDSFDELVEQLQDLSDEERTKLINSVQENQLESYLEIRGQYVDRLKDEGLLGRIPGDGLWADHCEKHPDDPICQGINPHFFSHTQNAHLLRNREIVSQFCLLNPGTCEALARATLLDPIDPILEYCLRHPHRCPPPDLPIDLDCLMDPRNCFTRVDRWDRAGAIRPRWPDIDPGLDQSVINSGLDDFSVARRMRRFL